MTSESESINGAYKSRDDREIPSTGHSVLVLFLFFIVILSLFGIVIALSYLCYRRAMQKRKDLQEQEEQVVLRRDRAKHPYRALAAASASKRRGNLNWYSPNPKDENALLLDGSIIPVHMQNNSR